MALTVSLLATDESPDDGGCVLNASTAAENDLLIAQITHDGSAPSTPSGWTLRGTQAGAFSHSISTYTKTASASETSYTFTHADFSGGVLIGVHSTTGDLPTLDFLASGNSAGNAQTSFDAPGGTMSAAGVIVTTWAQVDTGSTITKPASMTSLQSGDLFRSQATAYEAVSSGSTGTRTATATSNATWISAMVGVIEDTGDANAPAEAAALSVSAQNATVVTEADVTPGVSALSLAANNATVAVSGNVQAQAQVATISIVANPPSLSSSSNVMALEALISVVGQGAGRRVEAGVAEIQIHASDAAASSAGGTIANAGLAGATIAALNAAIAISENVSAHAVEASISFAAHDAIASSVVPPPPTYRFFPPTINENMVSDDPMIKRLHWEKGISVVKKGGVFQLQRYVVPYQLDGDVEGIHYFVGGYHYSGIPEDVALELIAAGFEPELEEV